MAVKPKLLVVDDDADLRGLLDYVLCGAGYDVMLAATGLEGVQLARKLHPNVILLDIMLPDVDGFTVAELLRRHLATAQIPIVVLSAHGGLSMQARGAECGVQRCLIKSVGFDQILASVREVLGQPDPSAT